MPFETLDVPVIIDQDGFYWTTAPVVYRGKTDTITVEPDFKTDLASVPLFLSGLVPVAGVHDRAAILHDWNCVQLADAYRTRTKPLISSVDTDALFRRSLRELGVRPYLRRLFWLGVRWGALFNAARRPGWGRTAPSVLAWSLLLLPTIVVPAVTTGLTLAVGRVVRLLVDLLLGVPGVPVEQVKPLKELRQAQQKRAQQQEVRAQLAARRRP
jgi:hypothetical protein